MSFKIIGTGMYVPEKVVTNDDLAQIVETNDEWITKRVGIKERRISETEFTSEMGAKAAQAALDNAGCTAADVDLILAASVSGETVSPSMACMIQNRIGATCPALEINAACAAFLYLLDTAAAYFALGRYKKILVVGCERMSGILDWSDRGTCVIFGDGAGAAVLEQGSNYLDVVCTVKGGDDVIKIPHALGCSPFFKTEQDTPYIHMQGQETFKYAVSAICDDIQSLLDRNGLTMDDIAYIVPHQANKRIIDFACKKLKISEDKMMVNIDKYGNTSSASVPIALHELHMSGNLKRGDKLILTAFGGGLSNMACLIEW
ncbi:MAG: ketoacyl-ACP synthase III [Oscillospiraceae bacterium]|nr:ketoacyl-ACP synthase III [Ruminococcus sp.]MBQ7002938.1 ketoacyl-ACP synthase III [Oscillospiraceae bacterium]MBQ7012843.1 ketoacyl-ACP synthase III [Oscillospiraceae bacterium]